MARSHVIDVRAALHFNSVRCANMTESQRQPGSVMKPIVYLAAFREGIFDLGSIVPDEPIGVQDGEGTKWISNYDGRFKGLIPIRQALAESRNAVAIWIALQVGIENVIRTSRLLGVKSSLHAYPTTALGALRRFDLRTQRNYNRRPYWL